MSEPYYKSSKMTVEVNSVQQKEFEEPQMREKTVSEPSVEISTEVEERPKRD